MNVKYKYTQYYIRIEEKPQPAFKHTYQFHSEVSSSIKPNVL